ncbi:hypothetical protein DFH07DRAFT_765217 [Mycena maculata]|uniref:Uncharacterized protein n=1 Tax=Mycena maculata TaxID=230809 RepID=A0AAD7NY38_9AGAR|nr:hypothetical protein DFH07DRAFT_765217 [Mycena maculata]
MCGWEKNWQIAPGQKLDEDILRYLPSRRRLSRDRMDRGVQFFFAQEEFAARKQFGGLNIISSAGQAWLGTGIALSTAVFFLRKFLPEILKESPLFARATFPCLANYNISSEEKKKKWP